MPENYWQRLQEWSNFSLILGTPICWVDSPNVAFKMPYKVIEGHTYGSNFNPVSPLMSIATGSKYAHHMITMKIPVTVPDGHIVMAFYYDSATGELQGVPMRKLEQGMLTVATRHFSEVVVSSVAKEVLGGEIPTEFRRFRHDYGNGYGSTPSTN